MKKLLSAITVLVLCLCLGSSALAVPYSGTCTHYFDTGSATKSGTSWIKMEDQCNVISDSPTSVSYGSMVKEGVPVNGSLALATRIVISEATIARFSWTSGANSYSSAKLRNYCVDEPVLYTSGDWVAW